MDPKYAIADIETALLKKNFPTVVLWSRAEGRPRTHDFDRALKAEVRDALWMLTKQWQMGEFKGDDAGSPVLAKAHVSTTALTKYQANGHPVQPFRQDMPLETTAEQREIVFERDGRPISMDIRLLMGKRWLRLASAIPDLSSQYIRLYRFELPAKNRSSSDVYAHTGDWQQLAAVSGRCMDGHQLYAYLRSDPLHKASDGLEPALTGTNKTTIDNAGDEFKLWAASFYTQPTDPANDAWQPNQFEYRFACSAPAGEGEKVFTAEEYYSGHPDWYTFNAGSGALDDLETPEATDIRRTFTNSFIPATVQFAGMPNRRWWTFEDSKTGFGNIKPSVTDIAKLMLIEFALVYGNDWFMVPFTLPTGSIAVVEGLSVTNNFGERFWIEVAGTNTGSSITDWSMFRLEGSDRNMGLLLAPTAVKVQEGNPLEEVCLIRDEMANMVWGIESSVPSVSGPGKSGKESGQERSNYHRTLVTEKLRITREASLLLQDINALPGPLPVPLAEAKTAIENILVLLGADDPELDESKNLLASAKTKMAAAGMNTSYDIEPNPADVPFAANISYLAMTSVPEHWIPFVPVHIKEDDNREIQLQRASLLRVIEGDTRRPEKIKPFTSALRVGLESLPRQAYYIPEEEVPRAGIQVAKAFQRSRWVNGEVCVWLGNQKKTGRGEGSSGLAFDQITDTDFTAQS